MIGEGASDLCVYECINDVRDHYMCDQFNNGDKCWFTPYEKSVHS